MNISYSIHSFKNWLLTEVVSTMFSTFSVSGYALLYRTLSVVIFVTLSFQSMANSEPKASTAWPAYVEAAIDDAPPYRIIAGGNISGIYVDIYEEVMRHLNVETAYFEVPFKRALHLLKVGQVDVMLGPIKNDERDDYADFSVPAFPPVKKLVLVNNTDNVVRNVADFRGKTIGVQRGSDYLTFLKTVPNINIVSLNDYRQALRMLKAGRVDLVIIPELIATSVMKRLQLSFIRSPYVIAGEDCYIAISKSSPVRFHIKEIKAALEYVKASGRYDNIVQRYINNYEQIDDNRAYGRD